MTDRPNQPPDSSFNTPRPDSQRMLRFEDDIVEAQYAAEEQQEAAAAAAAPGLDNVHLVSVTVHAPRLTHKIQGLEQKVNGTNLSDDYTTGSSWKLMPDVHKKKLTNFESEVRAICSKFNTPIRTRATNSDRASDPDGNVHMKRFYLKGLALVPDSRIDEMVEELERVHTEMRDYVRNEIAADMDTFRQEVREKLSPEAYEQARRHIPNANELLSKTGVEWLPIPIALGNTEVRDQLRGKMNEFYDAIAESVFSEPREEVAATITAFEELIQRDGQVTTRSLEPCRRAFEKLRSFQNLGDAELDRLISELELQLQEEGLLENLRAARSSDHTSVASVAANNGLSQALRNVRETASTEAESFQRHGRMSRGLVFNGGNDGQNEDENQSVEEEVPIQ